MDHIFEKPESKRATEKWMSVVPKIFRIAEREQNVKTIDFLGKQEYSDGELLDV